MGNKKFSNLRFAWKPYLSADDFVSTMRSYYNSGAYALDAMLNRYAEVGGRNAMLMDYLLLSGSQQMSHYFIETKELFNFLADSPVKEPSFGHFMAKSWGKQLSIDSATLEVPARAIVIHHQYPQLPSLKVMYCLLNEGTPEESFYVYVEDGDRFHGFSEKAKLGDSGRLPQEGFFISNLNDEATWDQPGYRYARLALNFLLYERCFPDKIRDGAPDEIANPNHYRRLVNKHTIHIAEPLLAKGSTAKTPHFRSGYFKTLASEYYTHKRGQVIFVDSTFVKGKAKIVESSSEVQASQNISQD